jgi:hypothetical protein
MNVDGVADTHPDERTWHLSVEGPVAERRSFREPPFKFDAIVAIQSSFRP